MNEQTVVVSAGTYHLPFERLVDWMDGWVSAHPEVRVVMQHGPSRPLSGAENHALLPYTELLALCRTADAVVLQGGAGGVMDMRELGRIPIVVPRVPVNDEVVDEHQLVFTQRAAELHVIWRVTTREQLWESIDAALAGTLETHAPHGTQTPGVGNISRVFKQLPEPLRLRERLRRLGRLIGSFIVRRRH